MNISMNVSLETLPNFIIFRFNDVVGIVNILMLIMLLREKICNLFLKYAFDNVVDAGNLCQFFNNSHKCVALI